MKETARSESARADAAQVEPAGSAVEARSAGPAPVGFMPRRRRGSRVWLVALVVLAAGVGGWWMKWGRHRGEHKRVYTTVKVDRGAVEEGITATGTLEAVETVDVGALVSGRVMDLRADENQEVKAGQVIAVIDPEPYEARVEQARASLSVASAAVERASADRRRTERERDRATKMGDQGVLGNADVDTAESAVELAKASEKSANAEVIRARAALHSAQLDLEHTVIVSPIDGLVLARPVEIGQSVNAGFASPTLFTIARDLGEMEVRTAIDEADVGKVKEGLDAKFNVDAYPGEDFRGTIAQIRRSPTVTQSVVTYEALIRVKNDDKRLWPGMTATVRVVTAHKDDVLRVPNAALRFKAPKDLTDGDAKKGEKTEGGGEKAAAGGGKAAAGGEKAAAGGDKAAGGSDRGAAPAGAPSRREHGGKGGAARPRKVWRLVPGTTTPEAIDVQVGIADEQFTEVTGGDLKEGDDLVTEIPGATGAKPAAGGAGGSRGGPRGPRF